MRLKNTFLPENQKRKKDIIQSIYLRNRHFKDNVRIKYNLLKIFIIFPLLI